MQDLKLQHLVSASARSLLSHQTSFMEWVGYSIPLYIGSTLVKRLPGLSDESWTLGF